MENTDELTDQTQPQPEPTNEATAATDNLTEEPQPADIASQFAQWLDNPLVEIALKDPRLCRFIGDLLSGENADCAAHRNFPQPPAPMPSDVAARHHLDDDTAQRIAQMGRTVMQGDWSDTAIGILLQAARHDADVADANAAGYLRGRNAAIEVKRRRSVPSF